MAKSVFHEAVCRQKPELCPRNVLHESVSRQRDEI